MKKIKNISLFSFFLFLLTYTSCSEEEFLEEINPNAITTETFWATEKNFNAALTTVYGALQFQSISGGSLQYDYVRGDIAGTESWYRPYAFRNLTYNDGIYYVSDKWNELYVGIFRANQVIEYIQEADDSKFSGNSKLEIEAQARFLRAFFYFEVAHNYGGAVLRTQVSDESLPFSSIEEVTNTVIIPDLEFAQNHLPKSWDASSLGRVTWGSAKSLLGKVYLFNENWQMASDMFEEVINSGIYALTPKIMDNFTDENEFNSESIFEVAYSAELNPGASGDAVDDSPTESGAEASTIASAIGQLSFGGYNTVLPSYYLHELFWYDEIDPTNPINNSGNLQSKRMNASIVPLNGEGLYYGLKINQRPGWGFGQSAYVKKYTNWYHLSAEDSNNRSGINFRHIRLADVYLMYAETLIKNTGDYSNAIIYIDKVRKRAGVKTIQKYLDENSNTFPQLHVSAQVHGVHPMVSPTSETIMTHLQRVERPLELCFEGHRWKDLVRWGIVDKVFSELREDEIWRENNLDLLQLNNNGIAPLFIRERVRPDFFLAAQNYTSSQHDYLPIPSSEVQTNNQLNK
ncbi:RagB/SusD family nutrient uptake outer membrane protein [Gelidibacter salicanalis]|uniref:RagB/SusD family nutrient uptake outer membrane protein n=1 Tax=Gelidibacter salicanalis TaxID=291193 RepID=A0A934KSW1_9FLAO|nr:RagB/SusD family nutrient uptake outer membrane protein [Gelidibacter salicanalis]MBJ7880122.1 RagB/SusD family nutrient uptake outer membrane protein [Gelidibacter salicanalis]